MSRPDLRRPSQCRLAVGLDWRSHFFDPRMLMPTHDEIFQKVQATLVDALGVDEDDVTRDATLQGDLGAESIDFLDIVFRLERNFGIKIPRGELFPENVVTDPEMIEGSKLTAKGLDELKSRMPFADLTRVRRRSRGRQDRRPLHGGHARSVRPEQARRVISRRPDQPDRTRSKGANLSSAVCGRPRLAEDTTRSLTSVPSFGSNGPQGRPRSRTRGRGWRDSWTARKPLGRLAAITR